jgi:hypothetical protein
MNPMSYIGLFLFGIFFLVMTAQATGSGLNVHLKESLLWLHAWAPFSYGIIVMILGAGVASIYSVLTWPKEDRKDAKPDFCRKTIVMEESAPPAE